MPGPLLYAKSEGLIYWHFRHPMSDTAHATDFGRRDTEDNELLTLPRLIAAPLGRYR